jgi:mono/diheme cytochrome c family protein
MPAAEFNRIAPGAGSSAATRSGAWVWLPCLLLALAACSSLRVGDPPASDASMGLLIARDSCGSCHGIGGGGESPNPQAPAFGEIASRPGMTPEALAAWLRDGHNYPIEMGFHLEPHQVDSLVAYMIRWRSAAAPPAP